MVGPDQGQLISSDGARVANPDGRSLDLSGRRTIDRVVNYVLTMPIAMMGKFKRKIPSSFENREDFALFEKQAINFAKVHGCEGAITEEELVPVSDK